VNVSNKEEDWRTVIRPPSGWFNIDLAELWQYRDLISLFVKRDFVSIYKQTVLGPLWFVLQPLFTSLVYTVIFGIFARISTDGVPFLLFYLSGILIWTYFGSCLNRASDTFAANAAIFGKVYFPRLTAPISGIITNLFTFLAQFVLFLAFLAYFRFGGAAVKPNVFVLLLPFLLLQLAVLGMGLGLIVASVTVKFRDLQFFISFAMQLWMYATPIFYPISAIPPRWQWVLTLNPVASAVTTFRNGFLGCDAINVRHLLLSSGISAMTLLIGVILFNRTSKTFIDTI
jgi:lipopolysaccharide transport system permease protein